MMVKIIMLSLLGLVLGSQALHADEMNGNAQSFWERLRGKIELLAPQRTVSATNATGGVRGAAVYSEDIYWKNDISAQAIASDELDAFKAAMKLAESNDPAHAQIIFSEFIKKYPESVLRKDAEQALALIMP